MRALSFLAPHLEEAVRAAAMVGHLLMSQRHRKLSVPNRMVGAWNQERRSRGGSGSRSARSAAATLGQSPTGWLVLMRMKSPPKRTLLVAVSISSSACTRRRARSNTECLSGPARMTDAGTSGGDWTHSHGWTVTLVRLTSRADCRHYTDAEKAHPALAGG